MSAKHAKITRFVDALSSIDEVEALIKAAHERVRQIRLEANEQAIAAQEAKWDAVRRAKKGHYAVVHAAAAPTRILFAPANAKAAQWQTIAIPQGTVLAIAHLQPRAKRAWMEDPDTGETYCFERRELALLDVRCYTEELAARVAAVAATEEGR